MASPNFLAGGNILPSYIVVFPTSPSDFTVVQATGSATPCVGVAQEGTFYAAGLNGSDSYAAHSGQHLQVYGPGEECLCLSDTTITAGNLIKPASNGRGTPVTASDTITTFVVGSALESTTGGNILFRLSVKPQEYVKV